MSNSEKVLSAQDKGKQNAKKVRDWLDTKPVVPIYQGKVNKTAICKMHGIPKSTIATNQALQELFAIDGPIEKVVAQQKHCAKEVEEPTPSEKSFVETSKVSSVEVSGQVEELKRKLNSIQLDLASEEFLIATGRYIPKLYDDSGSS
mgnify:FL=1